MDYKTIMDSILKKYKEILNENLVGIYLHGSIALNCFNWEKSDIDFIVVINERLSQETKLQLLKVLEDLRLEAPKKGLEMSVVLKEYCTNFKYPTPYELHYSKQWLEKYLENPLLLCGEEIKTDKDLAAHFTIIKHVGIVLYGQSIEEVFRKIPKESYIDSIKGDIENAKIEIMDNPMYIVLNLCRVLAYIKEDLILSKEQGALWGLENLPKEYSNLLKEALNSYRTDIIMNINKNEAGSFCEYMLDKIFN
ncbi:streptomycin 3'-adenylyltransferase [Clostridium punense]|uniref:Streptomycin 3'-adenylyltransferase n=1 Tax=Clostridium punense TaxID=1054297 RepID=A0ABS4K7A3_9CLOT|nr:MULTISPECIES: aminoglycoside adenylyltransferase domain-containing protein [Clostridium]EQB87243.1 hypothetical protein M918_10330 [Clostridium sp. BL8]MBP2023672.1 streptomycin 3'-adenylyltransferase [Clostridium punense]